MTIGFTLHEESGSHYGSSPYATSSHTPTANALQVVGVLVESGNADDASGIAGCGLTWHLLDTIAATGNNVGRIYVFYSMGASPSTGALSITTGAHDVVAWSWIEFTGVDTSGVDGAGAIVQSAKAQTTTSGSGGSVTATLAAFASANNWTYGFGFVDTYGGLPVVGSGFTAAGAGYDSAGYGACRAEYLAGNDTTVDMSNTTAYVDMAVIALEIKAASGGGGFNPAWAKNSNNIIGMAA